jgi:hypothetical protein
MPLQLIPSDWLRPVCAILAKEDTNLIRWTQDCTIRFEADFLFAQAWTYEVYPSLRAALSSPGITGCPVNMAHPAGTTWEFYFLFKNRRSYGKILLRPNHQQIVLFSAHLPLKPKLSCE